MVKKGYKQTEEHKLKGSISKKGKCGKYVRTPEIRNNCSIAHIGQNPSEETKKRISINASKFWQNKHRSENTKLKISIKLKERFKDKTKHPSYGKPNKRKGMCGLFHHSEETKRIISEKNKGRNVGINNCNWIDGRSKILYSSEFRKIRRSKIIQKRDNFKCQLCGDLLPIKAKLKDKKRATLHHIDYNKNNNFSDNLITLCNFCNTSVNTERNSWTKFFKEKIKNGNRI